MHLAMGDPQKTDPDNTAYNTSFKKAYTLGLLLPDIAKRGFIRLNRCIEDEYGVLARTRQILSASLLDKILSGFSVRFPESSAEPVYMNLENIRKCVGYFRRQKFDVITSGNSAGGWRPEEVWAENSCEGQQ